MVDSEKILQQLEIDELNVESDMRTCASIYYFYTSQEPNIQEELDGLENEMKIFEANKARELRKEFPKVLKEADIDRACVLDAEWQTLRMKVQEVKKLQNIYKLIGRAFEMKSRMLMSINKRELFEESKHLR